MRLESYVKENRLIEIEYDVCPESPRAFAQTKIFSWHRTRNLGERITVHDVRRIQRDKRFALVANLYMFEHGQMSFSLTQYSDPFDSGQVGLIAMTKEVLQKSFNNNLDKAREHMRYELDLFEAYCNGEVYSYTEYTLEQCECCGHTDKEVSDSCGGFFSVEDIKNQLGIDSTWKKEV